MYSDINSKLEQCRRKIDRNKKILAMLEQLEAEKRQLKTQLENLKKVLDKENLDVEKLEKTSLSAVFYSVIGKLELRKEKEQAEALAAKLKYNQGLNDLEDVEYQIRKLNTEKSSYAGCEEEYIDLFNKKKSELINEKGRHAHIILELTEKINKTRAVLIELEEAVCAGTDVLKSLDSAMGSLDSAEGWGTWDLFGGGLISDLAKHSSIDDAKYEIENTQRLLRRFKSELADIQIDSNIFIETEGFAKFADFFFDGLIADWYMQSKINQSQQRIIDVKIRVQQVLGELNHTCQTEQYNLKNLEAELEKTIAGA